MGNLFSGNAFHEEGMNIIKENVSDLGIAEYSFVAIKDKKNSVWSYNSSNNLKPEAVVARVLADHGYEVMGDEGRLIKQFFQLLCLVAYEEHENGSMITETGSQKIISLRPCFMTFPSASFTLEYIKNLLTTSSVDEVIEYIEIFGPVLKSGFQGFEGDDLDLIHSFLNSFTLSKLLNMFELALSTNSGLSGWPDIAAIKNNHVYFIEVKTTDLLTKNQKSWISIYKKSLDIDYRIIRLKQSFSS